MVQATTSGNANADFDARKALRREICDAAIQLAGRCTVSVSTGQGTSGRIDASQPVPGVPTWQLVEAISLLSILLRAESVHSHSVSLFTKVGPLRIEEGASSTTYGLNRNCAATIAILPGVPTWS